MFRRSRDWGGVVCVCVGGALEYLAFAQKWETYMRVVQDLRQRPEGLPGCRRVV